MKNWIVFALISMVFAGLTSVIAKLGLRNVSSDTGLIIRTISVVIVVAVNALVFQSVGDFKNLSKNDIVILLVSGILAQLSWISYFKAVKLGDVSQVALIDKGSIIITVILSIFILHEQLTLKTAYDGE